MRLLLNVCLCLGCVTLDPMISSAQGKKGGESEDLALEAFQEGKELYTAGNYIEASKKFREANELRPTWKLYFNIGQSEAASKRNGLAVEAFEMYLSMGGDDIPVDRHDLVVSEIKRLRPIVGFVSVTAAPAATVTIDEIERGTTPLPGPLMVSAGTEHQVRIEKDGVTLLERKVRVSGQHTVAVEAEAPVDETPAEPVEPEVTEQPDTTSAEPAEPKKSTKRSLGIAGLGVGAALLVSGAVTGGLALSQFKELDDDCPGNQCPSTDKKELADRADTLALATDILIPVGAVVGTVGIILLVLSRRDGESSGPVALRTVPVLGPDRGGLFLEGRF